jgi:hypothetical protein
VIPETITTMYEINAEDEECMTGFIGREVGMFEIKEFIVVVVRDGGQRLFVSCISQSFQSPDGNP